MIHVENRPTSEAQAALKLLAKKCSTWDAIMQAIQQGDQEVVDAYRDLKDSISAEQHNLCCYCEREIDGKSPQGHVEHVKPRAKFPKRTFDYENLACSCNGRSGSDKHCGHLKGGQYDDRFFVSPHDPLVESLFTYDIEGGIEASESGRKEQADHMITTLGLDCARLVSMRRGHGKGLVSTIEGFLGYEDALDIIREFAKEYVAPRGDGTLHQFVSLSRQIFAVREVSSPETAGEA